jgi:hypothetical protein
MQRYFGRPVIGAALPEPQVVTAPQPQPRVGGLLSGAGVSSNPMPQQPMAQPRVTAMPMVSPPPVPNFGTVQQERPELLMTPEELEKINAFVNYMKAGGMS